MNTTTIIAGIGAAAATGFSLYDKEKKTIKKDNVQTLIGTSVAVTATAVGAETVNNIKLDEIHQRYSSAYVESMTDEQLEEALIKMDLLLPEEDSKVDEKTL